MHGNTQLNSYKIDQKHEADDDDDDDDDDDNNNNNCKF